MQHKKIEKDFGSTRYSVDLRQLIPGSSSAWLAGFLTEGNWLLLIEVVHMLMQMSRPTRQSKGGVYEVLLHILG